jgi:hypothetical protein
VDFWNTGMHPARFIVEPGPFGPHIGASLRDTQELTSEGCPAARLHRPGG